MVNIKSNNTAHCWFKSLFKLLIHKIPLWLSNLSILSVPDEGYSRNALCALNLISTFYYIQWVPWVIPSPKGNVINYDVDEHEIWKRNFKKWWRDHRGHDHMVVWLTTTCAITNKVLSFNPAHGKVYSIQQYLIKFVSDLWQLGDFPPPIKLTATM